MNQRLLLAPLLATWAAACVAETSVSYKAVGDPGVVRMCLPPSVPAVVGQECNVYFANVVLSPDPETLLFDVVAKRGRHLADRWTWKPTADDVGEQQLRLEVRDSDYRTTAWGQTTIRVAAAPPVPAAPLSVLCIGDSLTHASVYTQRLLDLATTRGDPWLRLIGTNWIGEAGPNRHEGYSGWTAKHFTTHHTGVARGGDYAKRGSPFLYVGTDDAVPRLDFSRYYAEASGDVPPDVVTIFLGANDVGVCEEDALEATIDEMFARVEEMVAAIRLAGAQTRVAILTLIPPAASQDAFGASYGSGLNRWRYRRNQHRLVERAVETFAARERENVFVVPTHLNLDTRHNYPIDKDRVNAANDQTVRRQADGVHPARSGYEQVGDTLFAWIVNETFRPTDVTR